MSIRNVEIQTIGLHIGTPDHSKVNPGQRKYTKAGIFTSAGLSIFGDCSSDGGKATVTIGVPESPIGKLGITDSLNVTGNSKYFGDIFLAGNQTITKNLSVTQNVTIGGTMRAGFATWSSSIVATSKLFDIEHPSKGKGHRLAHASLEGPEIGVYHRGRTRTNEITLPDYWKDLVRKDSITVQLQPIGHPQKIIVKEFDNEKIIIDSENTWIDCFYHVYGERKDVDKLTVEYQSDTIMEQGKPK